MMHRRDFLARASLAMGAALAATPRKGLAAPAEQVPSGPSAPAVPTLPLVRARTDRIIKITVCLRPFRAQGPRLEVERIGSKTVVHNYGHGGSGWSLSWGSSTIATQHALATGERDYAVIGCGALGLTSALLLQRAGRRVTIYAKERPPEVRSSFATGVWSPDSRICLEEHATPAYGKIWNEMCRTSFRAYQNLLGLPGDPVAWYDRYALSDIPMEEARKKREAEEGPVKFGKFQDLVKDLTPAPEDLPPDAHPFGAPYVRRATTMVFNLAAYQRLLVNDFLAAGGRLETREFFAPGDFERLPEHTIIHATGYGARALFGDESLTPVRGQLCLLIPQPEITYGLSGDDVSMVPRRDGIVVQSSKKTDFGNADDTPDRAESEKAVLALAKLCARMRV
ncbi:MAG TPA: FAD-dependent oxidoreductase [Opitutaceae bacterium]